MFQGSGKTVKKEYTESHYLNDNRNAPLQNTVFHTTAPTISRKHPAENRTG